MSEDISGFRFWVNNPDFRLFANEDDEPAWCDQSLPLIEWGDNLLSRLAQDPAPLKVGYAKWKLLDRYARLYCRTTPDHRAETNLDNHLCIHQALLHIWQRMEDMELQAAIPELEPPHVQLLLAPPEPEPAEEEITGVIIGTADTEASDKE